MPKISQLPSVATLSSADVLPVVDGGATKQATVAQVLALVPVPTGTGLRKVVSGTENAAASLLVNADVDPAAAIAASKLAAPGSTGQLIWNSASAFAATSGIATDGSTYVSIGSNPAASLTYRAPNGGGLAIRNVGNTADIVAVTLDSSNYLRFGTAGAGGGHVHQYFGTWGVYNGSGYDLLINANASVQVATKLRGLSAAFKFDSASISMSADTTLTSTQAECVYLDLTSTGAFSLICLDAKDSTHNIKNSSSSSITVKKSGGTGFALAAGTVKWARHNGTDYEARS